MTARVVIRRDISALRARHAILEPRESKTRKPSDNKRVAVASRSRQPVLVKITSPYDSRGSYDAHTRVIITGNDAAAHFGYSRPLR